MYAKNVEFTCDFKKELNQTLEIQSFFFVVVMGMFNSHFYRILLIFFNIYCLTRTQVRTRIFKKTFVYIT